MSSDIMLNVIVLNVLASLIYLFVFLCMCVKHFMRRHDYQYNDTQRNDLYVPISINNTQHNNTHHTGSLFWMPHFLAQCRVPLCIEIVMLRVVMLNVVMLSLVAPFMVVMSTWNLTLFILLYESTTLDWSISFETIIYIFHSVVTETNIT
jgi:hypothetical protein